MSLSVLLHQVQQEAAEGLYQAAALPAEACFHFDPAQEAAGSGGAPAPGASGGGVQKTVRRTVVSLNHGRFQARETVRQAAGDGRAAPGRSAELAEIVPSGARYAFDLIAHVGVQTYLRGRSLQDLREELAHRRPAVELPLSTLWDQQQKFLFYEAPQLALCKRLRTLKLQYRLKEQRRGQNEWLRQRPGSPAACMLADVLAGRVVEVSWDDTLAREVLLAFHFWILDYRSDGRRRGFPFDPYLLYLHRRLVRAGEAVDRLLSQAAVACRMPQVFRNFQALLQAYRSDSEILAAADLYERFWTRFTRLREVLRLSAEQLDQLRQPQELPVDEQRSIQRALHHLRQELQQQTADEHDRDRPLARIVLAHLDKYWEHLVPDSLTAAEEPWQRTTNQLESDWGALKRRRRRTHGRGKLTRDFQSLPEEYPLIRNLENETYLELVLGGSLASLPAKLAEVSREAGSFEAWRRRRRPCLPGELPRRLLRADDFVDHLLDTCVRSCQATAPRAA